MFSFCALFSVSSHGHTLVFLSLLRFYSIYFRGPGTILDLYIFLFILVLQISLPVSFRFNLFPSIYWLFLTFLYLYLIISPTHFVGRQFGRILRAGLSSNGSSESYSDSLSKLTSHQIPRCFVLRVPLQLKGCTRSPTMCSTTTPSGASVL